MAKQKKEAFEVKLTKNALQNIDEITGYIAFVDHQPVNAAKVADALFDIFDRIAQNPFVFRECEQIPTLGKLYRRAVCLSWLVIYKITGTEILILGVIHKSRNPSKIKLVRKKG